ncbi:MAG: outer membrane beta-barrel protein [Saprospiraceae bacterium]
MKAPLTFFKYRLFPKKIIRQVILLILISVANQVVTAQRTSINQNYLAFQQKDYYFGITLAFNQNTYRVFRSKTFITSTAISSVEGEQQPGFSLGIIANLKVGNYIDFRLLPTISFTEQRIDYSQFSNIPFKYNFNHTNLELPFHFRYKSAPYRDIRLFMIGGVKYSFDMASNSQVRQADELVKIAPTDFAFEVGAGIQFFFPYFSFSPEFKYSQGIGNSLIHNERLEPSSVLDKVLSRTFTISLHFEG